MSTNRIHLGQLASLTNAELQAVPLPQIAMLLEDADAQKKVVATYIDRLNAELNRRFGTEAQQMRKAEGKDTGVVTLLADGVKVKADLRKQVAWKQSLLAQAVETIKSWGENPADYVDIEVAVSEARFNAWPPAIRKLFEPARTVSTGKPTFKLELVQEAA